MLVKHDKRHSCYHYLNILEDLTNIPAEHFAEAIKGKPENLNCKTAYDLVFNVSTRFKSIVTFRDSIFSSPDLPKIKESPIMLLDPIKPVYQYKYKYNLE